MTLVVHITSAHEPYDVRIFQKECRSLAKAQYQVTLIAPTSQDSIADGICIKALPTTKSRARRLTITVWKALKEALREPADIFHFHDPELLPAGLILAVTGRRVIYDCHENVAGDFLNREWIPERFRKPFAKFATFAERLAVRWFSGVVVADEQLVMRFRDATIPVVNVGNYPILGEFPQNLNIGASRYSSGIGVNFGGASKLTAIEPLVQAMGMIPKTLPFRLTLGGGCDSDDLLQKVAALPGWQRVDYQGPVQRKEMIEKLSRAAFAVVMYKYKDQGDDLAIRSNRFFEALAAGLPVITSNFSRWRRFVDDTGCGFAVDPDKPTEIATAIQFLIEHPETAEEMGRRGFEVVRKKYSWESEEGKLLALYAQLTNGHKKYS